MRLTVVSIPVTDQDRAKAFYTEKLGFGEHTDQPMDDAGNRWLTLTPPEGGDGVTLLLERADEPTVVEMKRRKGIGMPATAFATGDLAGEYKTLCDAGVTFTMPPTTLPYGGTDAIFEDSEGNLICLHQDA